MKTQLLTGLSSDFLILESESKIEGFKLGGMVRVEGDSEENRFHKAEEVLV